MLIRIAALVLALSGFASAECISFEKAGEYINKDVCVAGKVISISETRGGTQFLNFCEDWRSCPFTVVVFPKSLRDVGDIRELKGKEIQIRGRVKLYNERPEIILEDVRQLLGEAAKIPPVPRDYDAQRKGNFRAGSSKKNY